MTTYRNLSLAGREPAPHARRMRAVVLRDLIARGAVRPVISEACGLEDLAAVCQRMDCGGVTGRIVLRLDGRLQ